MIQVKVFYPGKYILHARTPLLMDLHWLPVKQRITFKTALNMFKTVSNTFQSNFSDTFDFSKPKLEDLRSQSNLVVHVPRSARKFGDQSFSIAGPHSWYSHYYRDAKFRRDQLGMRFARPLSP